MKFTCNQAMITKALNIVSKAVSTRTTIPVLKGILIEATTEGTIRFAASDLDLSIENKIQGDVEEAGSVVVSAKLFSDIVRKLPYGEIEITSSDDNKVLISGNKAQFNIVGLPAEEFPSFGDTDENAETFFFNKDVFKEMVSKTAFSASIDEAKGVITGVLIELTGEKMNMVALDGFRMAIARADQVAEKKNIIINSKIINELSKIIQDTDGDEDMKLSLENKKAVAVFPNTKVVMRLLDGDYIRYKDIIPKEHKIRIVLNRLELQDSIERASLLAKEGKNNLVKIKLEDNTMIITSRSEEGNVKEEVMIEKDGDDLEIGFNSKYIIDAIKAVDDEEIAMEFNAAINPCLIKPVEGDKFEYLILPVRITSGN